MVQADALRDLFISIFSYPVFSVSQRVGSSIPGHAPLPQLYAFYEKLTCKNRHKLKKNVASELVSNVFILTPAIWTPHRSLSSHLI